MKRLSLYIALVLLFVSCSHVDKEIKSTKISTDNNSVRELFLPRIKAAANCDGIGVDVELQQNNQKYFTNKIWVFHGECVIFAHVFGTDSKIPVPTRCKFMVDRNLEFVLEGDWDGKCLGARHTIHGKVEFYGYEFTSDADNPLVFMMTDKGYQYIEGNGFIKDMLNDKIFKLANDN